MQSRRKALQIRNAAPRTDRGVPTGRVASPSRAVSLLRQHEHAAAALIAASKVPVRPSRHDSWHEPRLRIVRQYRIRNEMRTKHALAALAIADPGEPGPWRSTTGTTWSRHAWTIVGCHGPHRYRQSVIPVRGQGRRRPSLREESCRHRLITAPGSRRSPGWRDRR